MFEGSVLLLACLRDVSACQSLSGHGCSRGEGCSAARRVTCRLPVLEASSARASSRSLSSASWAVKLSLFSCAGHRGCLVHSS